MTDEALHVTLVIGIINLSDPANLVFFTLRAKLALTKIFRIKRQVADFIIIAISLKFCLLPCIK